MKKLYTNVDLMAKPTNPEHLVNKEYVDSAISRKVKDAVRLVSCSDVDFSTIPQPTDVPPFMVDDVEVKADDRILLTGQTDTTQNGIYVYKDDGNGTFILERSEDMDSNEDLYPNMMIPVREGKQNFDTTWVLTNDDDFEIGKPLIFSKFKGQEYVSSFTGTFEGDGTTTEFDIEHGLGTESVNVVIKDVNNEVCVFNVVVKSENVVTIKTDCKLEVTDKFTVVVMG